MVSAMKRLARWWLAACLSAAAVAAWGQGPPIGIVIMHGKGGSPMRLVADLARSLESRGCVVANIEMPWSGRRNYDVDVSRGEEEVAAAAAALRARGAGKVFVAGHSQGGAFALHLAGRQTVDGIIAIAPGGSVGGAIFREKLGDALGRARRLVAEGKGNEPARLEDYEGSRGTYSFDSIPAAYVTWFDPEGAMNMDRAVRAANPRIPILWIAPTRDYPGLRKTGIPLFRQLPANALTRLYEPDADHRGAPSASGDEIIRWTKEVAAASPG